MKNKLIIFGASGFIGKNLIHILNDLNVQFDIVVRNTDNIKHYLNSNTRVYKCDLFNYLDIKKLEIILQDNQYEECIDLAWYCGNEYQTSLKNFDWINITLNIAKLFAQYGGKKFVFTGSVFEYENTNKLLCEYTTSLNTQMYYGISKSQCANILNQFFKRCNIQFKHARIFNLFGKYENQNRLIPYIIQQTRINDIVKLNENILCDYSYVVDVCYSLYKFLKSDITGPVNICSNKLYSIKDIAYYISKLNNSSINNIFFKNEQTNKCIYGDNYRLKNDVKYNYKYSLYEGLNKIIYESDKI